MSKEITMNLTKALVVIGENSKGYTKEVNLVSWNNAGAKIDIREWHPEHERCVITSYSIHYTKLYEIFSTKLQV